MNFVYASTSLADVFLLQPLPTFTPAPLIVLLRNTCPVVLCVKPNSALGLSVGNYGSIAKMRYLLDFQWEL